MDKTKRRVFVQFAMRVEAKPLIERIGAIKVEGGFPWASQLPFEFYQKQFSDLEVLIGIAGLDPIHGVDSIGSVPAAVLAQVMIQNFKPSLLINAGTCGGFQALGHKIAEVFVGSKYVAFHHRRSSIPAMREYGIGKYPVADTSALRIALNLSEGIVTSGDALDFSQEDEDYISANGGTLKEMEAAAIGWVASFYKIPLIPIKAVTDWVDHPADTGEQFKKNYRLASEQLADTVVRVLQYLEENLQDKVWRSEVGEAAYDSQGK